MFGKRPPAQQPEDDFESQEMTQNFTSESEDDAASMDDDGESWGESSDDGLGHPGKPARKGGSALSKILPFAAIGFLGAAGAGYYYVNYMAPKAGVETPAIIATQQEQPGITAAAGGDVAPVIQPAPGATETPAMPSEASEAAVSPVTAATGEEQTLGSISATDEPSTTEPMAAAPSNLVAGDPSLAAPETVSAPSPAPEVSPTLTAEGTASTPATEQAPPASTEPETAPMLGSDTSMMAPTPAPAAAVSVTATRTQSTVAAAPATSTVLAAPASTVSASVQGVSPDKVADMSQRLDVLEHQIDDLTKAVDRLASTSAAPDTSLAATVSDLQSEVARLQNNAQMTASTTTRVAPPPVATRSAPRPTSTPAAPRAAAPAAHSSWVLRAAQDGEAWISASTQGQLRHVKVGETVNGLGRITSIQLKNGRWVVTGTQGTVSQ